MSFLRAIASGVVSLFRKKQVERELDEELHSFLDMAVEGKIKQGMSRREAARAVRLERGGLEATKEVVRSAGWESFVETCWQDLRFGVRILRKNPGFTTVAVLTLALGIGANTAIFTVVNGVLLRPMPFPGADKLFLISLAPRGGPFEWQPGISDRDYLAFHEQNRAFENVCSFTRGTTASLTGAGDPAQIPVAYVTSEFFSTLRIGPIIGRGFIESDGQSGGNNVVVLSYEMWKVRFGADPGALGRTIKLDGVERTVVGVMPSGFQFPGAKAWLPLTIQIDEHNSFTRPVVGRLKPGVSVAQAKAELEMFAQHRPRGLGEDREDRLPQILPLKDLLVANVRVSLWVLMGAVSFVLLIACANVASLFLVRAAGRSEEMAVRSALGADRRRLARQLATESTILAFAGGAAGLILATWGVPALLAIVPVGKVPRTESIHMDGAVLAFTFGVSAFASLLFGLAPALQLLKRDARFSLGYAAHQVTGRHERLRTAIAILEIALALMLLAGAGLMLKSFLRLRAVEPGFAPQNVMTATVDLADTVYTDAGVMKAFHERALAELSRLPGAVATGAVNWLPLGESLVKGTFQVEGWERPSGLLVDKPGVSGSYFRAMGIRLLRGREFTDADNGMAPGVAIVSESVARTLWPGEDPIGKRISLEDEPKPEDWLTVVGVVQDLKQETLSKSSDPAIYQSLLQVRRPFFLRHMSFVIKTAASPESAAAEIRTVLRNVDKDQAVSIASMDRVVATTIAEPRFQTRLLGIFAVIALGLTLVGVYGALAYAVSQRTKEIGLRMALGAVGTDVLKMVLQRAVTVVLSGIAIGTAGALITTRVLMKFLFEVKPNDPATYAVVCLALALSALLACWIPARRAMRVDPMVALRYE
jgi:putative ABC transport system permease protein